MSDGTFEFSSRWPTNAFTIYDKKVVEIMRVSAEGVKVNPDIPADDAVRAVLSVLDQQIKQMVEQAVAAAPELHAENERLRAERDALRADAERYRWLRECARATSEHWGGRWSLVIEGPAPQAWPTPASIDAAIDAAREAKDE